MTLKEQINSEFVTAFKARNERKKSALSMLKAKITEGEKANKNTELTDAEVMKVILAQVKQRKQSIEEFTKAGRTELVEKEIAELESIEAFLPKQMSDSEIEAEVRVLIQRFPEVSTNRNALIGKTMGAFNKEFQGKAEPQKVKAIIESLV